MAKFFPGRLTFITPLLILSNQSTLVQIKSYNSDLTRMPNVLIVGGNRGIGLSLVKQYAAVGNKVWSTCRTAGGDKIENVTIVPGIDTSSDEVIANLKNAGLPDKLDIVIVNAGVGAMDKFENLPNTEECTRLFNINAVGPLRVAKAVESRLKEGSKFAAVTSRMGSMADNGSGNFYGYRMSKAALNAAMTSLKHDFKKKSVSVAILHPGFVQTDMTSGRGDITADQSAEGLIKRVAETNMENTGTFWHQNGEILPW